MCTDFLTDLKTVLRLFTTVFPEESLSRRAEYEECLKRNLACSAIDEICILVEGNVAVPKSMKIRTQRVVSRPTYADFFGWIHEVAHAEDISIIANSDIWFDERIKILKLYGLPHEDEVYALSRWDMRNDGSAALYDHNDSQDSWIVRGRVQGVDGQFPLGVARCDNKIACEFFSAGYKVRNPSFSIRSFHLHAAVERFYLAPKHSLAIPPPYHYVWPHNLFSIPRTLWNHIRFQGSPVAFAIDRRRLNQSIPVKIIRKLTGLQIKPFHKLSYEPRIPK